MEIKLKREHLIGTELYNRWDELYNIYLKNIDLSQIIKNAICEWFDLGIEVIQQQQYGKAMKGKQIFATFAYLLTRLTQIEISYELNVSEGSVKTYINNFKNFYKLESDYRYHVHSIAVKLPIEQQEKVHKYLKKLR